MNTRCNGVVMAANCSDVRSSRTGSTTHTKVCCAQAVPPGIGTECQRREGPSAATVRTIRTYGAGYDRPMAERGVIELFQGCAATFNSVLDGVRPEQHHLPTPCHPLDVSELVARAVGHQDWVRGRIAGSSDPPSYPPIEPDRWTAAFDASTVSMVDELRQDGAMDRTVTLAAGLTFSRSDVAVLAARNIFQYAWDLAVATDQGDDLAPDVAAQLLDISRTRLVPQRGPDGFFGPEFVPPAGSPVATVLAGYLGREV